MPSSIRPMRDSSFRLRPPPEELTIVDWPLRDRPLASSVAMTLAAGASWIAAWATQNIAAGAIVAAILLLTLWRDWLPVRYELGSGGIVQSVLLWRRRIGWGAIRSVEIQPDGAVLMADFSPTPLSPLRGIYLHWGSQREAVMQHLDYYIPGRAGGMNI